MKTTFEHLTLWARPSHYIGATWFDYYPLAGQSRDSDELEQSNFRSFKAALDAKAKELNCVDVPNPDSGAEADRDETIPAFTVERSSHWAVGWVETLLVHKDAPQALLEWCDAQLERLDNYPVFDEEDYSELEMESADETWKNCYNVAERVEYIRRHRSQFEFHDFADLLGCVRGNYFAGYASELLSR
jgi:hypothetical protein